MRILERLIQKVSPQLLGFHAATRTDLTRMFDATSFQALEFVSMRLLARLILKVSPVAGFPCHSHI